MMLLNIREVKNYSTENDDKMRLLQGIESALVQRLNGEQVKIQKLEYDKTLVNMLQEIELNEPASQVIAAMIHYNKPLSASNIAEGLKIPRTTIYPLLKELTEFEFISYDGY